MWSEEGRLGRETVAVVLVHGAWHGVWCWDAVVSLLADRGIRAVCVDLYGGSLERARESSLHDHAARLRGTIDAVASACVVVGHSYGGAVITEGAANHGGVVHLVYVAAHMPDETETAFGLADSDPAPIPLYAGIVPSDDGSYCTVDPEVAPLAFFNGCDDALAAVACARLVPHSTTSLIDDTPAAVAWRDTPSTYVVCEHDQALGPAVQRRLATRASQTEEWSTGHSPWMSHPAKVADLLAKLVRQAQPPTRPEGAVGGGRIAAGRLRAKANERCDTDVAH